MIKVLITQGGAGSLSLINDLSKTLRKKIIFYGTHFDRIILKRADKISKKNFVAKVDEEKNTYHKI